MIPSTFQEFREKIAQHSKRKREADAFRYSVEHSKTNEKKEKYLLKKVRNAVLINE